MEINKSMEIKKTNKYTIILNESELDNLYCLLEIGIIHAKAEKYTSFGTNLINKINEKEY